MKFAKALCLGTALFAALPAAAQQVTAPEAPKPFEQALSSKLSQEINNVLQCTTQTITLQQQVQKLEAELKALKETPAEPETKK